MLLNWDDFTILTLRDIFPKQIEWDPTCQVLFRAETCSRHIYVGLKSDFEDLPEGLFEEPEILRTLGKEDFCRGIKALYSGREAYLFFVQYIAGLNSRGCSIDNYVSGQVTSAWNNYSNNNPSRKNKLQPFMDALFSDAALIKRSILNAYSSQAQPVNTAVKMARLTPSDKVLVVGGERALTTEVIKYLGHKKPHTPNEITLTHPDEGRLGTLCEGVRRLGKKSAIKARLIGIPFDRALQDLNDGTTTVFNAAAIFVCSPAQEMKINKKLIDAWWLRSKVYKDNPAKLFDLGDPAEYGAPTSAWKTLAGTEGFIPYSYIVEENNIHAATIERVVAKANEAIEHLSELRMQGDRAVTISFIAKPNEMTLDYRLARRPLGPATGENPSQFCAP
ncbi:MAG: hypothetical protein PHW76_06720 [Alphaproteobacteria bacterium]|nr:hypothetical protein [Alphaproteobacteria bacterium]